MSKHSKHKTTAAKPAPAPAAFSKPLTVTAPVSFPPHRKPAEKTSATHSTKKHS